MIQKFSFDEALISGEFKKLKQLILSPENLVYINYQNCDILSFDKLNQELLKSISQKAIVYTIWTGIDPTQMRMKYIGHANERISRQRIRNHLCNKNKNTGAKLEHIKKSLKDDLKIAVSIVEVLPEYMRKAFETWFIQKEKETLEWNINT